MSRAATVRAYNKAFDPSTVLQLIEATTEQDWPKSSGRLPNGRMVSVYPGRPGKVTVMLSEHDGAPFVQRTFGINQHAQMVEWVRSGGTIQAEERKKAITQAAPELLAMLRDACTIIRAARGAPFTQAEELLTKLTGE